MSQKKQASVRIAGATILDPDVITALEATKHLDPCNRHRVLGFAAHLVEWDMLGFNAPVRRVQAATPENPVF